MKRTTRKLFICAVCILLAAVMFSILVFNVLAAEDSGEKLYVKDVKLIYADSMSKAKQHLPAGYQILGYDLNKGSDGDHEVYMAYSTTKDPEEAITDIKLMNMNGGFVYSDYNDQIKNADYKVKELASELKTAVSAFRENYLKGTYGAMAAYRALSYFTVESGESLADYLIYVEPDVDFYIKVLLNVHRNILSAILTALTMAVQGEAGDTWLDRLAKITAPKDVDEEVGYWDKGEALWSQFNSFYTTFKTIDPNLFKTGNGEIKPKDEEGVENPGDVSPSGENPSADLTGIEALYVVAYKTLQSYSFASGIKFNEWCLDPELETELLYCLVATLTPAEYAMMHLCGPLNMILSCGMSESVYNDYIADLQEITGDESVCSIWTGVNLDLFRSSIGVTNAANRAIAETKYEAGLTNDGDGVLATTLRTAGLIAACGAVSLGVGLIAYYGFGSLLFTCFSGTALTAAASNVAIVGTIFGMAASALGIVAIAIAVIIAIVVFFIWLFSDDDVEYTTIPEYMYDFVEDDSGNTQFVLYEGVTFQDGKEADVNVWEGKEWQAMYVSRDKAAGAPIEADFKVKYGDARRDTGYAGLSTFGQVNPENFNKYAEDDEVNGIYVTYRQEDLKGDYARGDYLADLRLFSDENEEKCKLKLRNQNYTVYDVNLTPDTDYYTYLGYKTTNSASRALTDIRLAIGYSSSQYAAGGGSMTYAESGITGDGKITLYTTKISQFGSPIRSDFMVLNKRNAPLGYEPVNLFSGGPAVSVNFKEDSTIEESTPFYIYFLPSKTYTGGTEYIGGIATAYDVSFSYSSGGVGDALSSHIMPEYKTLYTTKGGVDLHASIIYTTTYNPYRAIYGVTAVKSNDTMGNAFSQTISYDGVGYSIAASLLLDKNLEVSYETVAERSDDVKLYVAGIYAGGAPMLVSDIAASNDPNAPSGFTAVYARMSGDGRAVDLVKGYSAIVKDVNSLALGVEINLMSMYLFVRGEGYKEGNYVTGIVIANKDAIIGDIDIDCEDLDNSYLVNTLGANGGHVLIGKNLNLKDSDNTTYLAYTKAYSDNRLSVLPMTDLILYYAGNTNLEPTDKLEKDGITYHLISSVNLFADEDGATSKCKRVYLYYTTNPAAGSSILDIKIDNTPIINGWETVRTQNDEALDLDMDSYSGSMWYIHMKRNTTEPKYISEIVVGIGGSEAEAKAKLVSAGCEYIVEKDLNNNIGLWSDYIYLGYKRTSDPNEAIRDLKTTHNSEVDGFILSGATYHKIEGNLNAYTTVFADDIFLYYTKDSKAGTPITSLGTSATVANWSHGEGYRYVVNTVLNKDGKPSDLNDGVAGDTIYLLQTKDRQDSGVVATMIGDGSLAAVIVLSVIALGAIAAAFVVRGRRASKKGNVAEEDSDLV